jgi:hypothetical protein
MLLKGIEAARQLFLFAPGLFQSGDAASLLNRATKRLPTI